MQSDRTILASRFASISRARQKRGRLTVDALLVVDLPANIRQKARLHIVFPLRYPRRPPSAFILGNVFVPRDRTRHFMDDGSCCLFLRGVDEPWNYSDQLALDAWLDQVVLFIARQIILDRLGRWSGVEWEHGFAAYDQHVRETLGDMLTEHFYRHRRLTIAPSIDCPCGATAAFGDCHQMVFEQLKTALSGSRGRRVRSRDPAQLAN